MYGTAVSVHIMTTTIQGAKGGATDLKVGGQFIGRWWGGGQYSKNTNI